MFLNLRRLDGSSTIILQWLGTSGGIYSGENFCFPPIHFYWLVTTPSEFYAFKLHIFGLCMYLYNFIFSFLRKPNFNYFTVHSSTVGNPNKSTFLN